MNEATMSTPKVPQSRFLVGMLAGIAFGSVVTLAVSWSCGFFRQPYQPIEEAKMCCFALTQTPNDLQPQTREYLKGRLYWNASVWISPPWLEGWHIDFGPVDDAALGGLRFAKDASTSLEVYQAAISKHPQAASKPK
jgi:hypothetical protein